MKSWTCEYVRIEETKTGAPDISVTILGSLIPPSNQSDIALPHTYSRNRMYNCEEWLEI